jgi:hypothetical protein
VSAVDPGGRDVAGRRRAIIVVGGYGAFGGRIVERLSRDPDLRIVIAGRSATRAEAAAAALSSSASARIDHAAIDALLPDLEVLRSLEPAVIINASGPFQAQDYALAEAAIAVGAHYVDLADARAFVTGIGRLDRDAREAGVLVTSGASSVPAVAAAIIDHHQAAFSRLDSIWHGIVPANGYDPGIATVGSILGGVGRPFHMLLDGEWREVHGWQGLSRYRFEGLGPRLMSYCDVPDVVLFPERYPGLRTARFTAGLEVAPFHLALWCLSWLVRWGAVGRPERLARPLMWTKRRLSFLGSDSGGMFLRLDGLDHDGRPLRREIGLIARDDKGPYVPTIASVVLARRLARGEMPAVGAMPCLGLITQAEFEAEVSDLPITIEARTQF